MVAKRVCYVTGQIAELGGSLLEENGYRSFKRTGANWKTRTDMASVFVSSRLHFVPVLLALYLFSVYNSKEEVHHNARAECTLCLRLGIHAEAHVSKQLNAAC